MAVVRAGPRDLPFSYDGGYRRSRDVTPLSLSMPLTTRTHGNKVVEAYMRALLLDDNNVLCDRSDRAVGRVVRSAGRLAERRGDQPADGAGLRTDEQLQDAASECPRIWLTGST